MPKAKLVRAVRFLPLGVLWGLVAAWFHTHAYLSPWDGYDEVDWVIPVVTIAFTCPISTLMGVAMLKRQLPSLHWVANWVITGVASCVGTIGIIYLTLLFWVFVLAPPPSSLSNPVHMILGLLLGLALVSMGPLIEVGIGSLAVATVTAPLSLLVRWLILRRRPVAEPAGGASEAQP